MIRIQNKFTVNVISGIIQSESNCPELFSDERL